MSVVCVYQQQCFLSFFSSSTAVFPERHNKCKEINKSLCQPSVFAMAFVSHHMGSGWCSCMRIRLIKGYPFDDDTRKGIGKEDFCELK